MKLANIEKELGQRVVGQKQAIEAVANAIRRNRVGLRNRVAPIGSFLLLGPTGVGKTELAKALSEHMLNDESRLIRFDMSEFMERHEASKLIGSPPGYVGYSEGGQLTERIRRQPFSVVLFDEVEKAHPDIFNMFLQILDDGHLTDGEGNKVSFEHTVVVFTSNLGGDILSSQRRKVGLSAGSVDMDDSEIQEAVTEEVKKFFKPEFLNRLDDLIVFHKLTADEIAEVFRIQWAKFEKVLKDRGHEIRLDPAAKDHLVQRSWDPVYGARPLRRLLEREIENQVALLLIKAEASLQTCLDVTLQNGAIRVDWAQSTHQPRR